MAVGEGRVTYQGSGVDIGAGDALVTAIKDVATASSRSGVLGHLGSFGGLFDLQAASYSDPILVSGTDGVGTKLMVCYLDHRVIFEICNTDSFSTFNPASLWLGVLLEISMK